jgi:hypothetical protein
MTLQINLKQLKADGASNSHVLSWSNTANSWVSTDVNSILDTSALSGTFTGPVSFSANVTFANAAIIANGDVGSAGQVLTSDGNTGIYWADASSGGVTSYNDLTNKPDIISPFMLMGA